MPGCQTTRQLWTCWCPALAVLVVCVLPLGEGQVSIPGLASAYIYDANGLFRWLSDPEAFEVTLQGDITLNASWAGISISHDVVIQGHNPDTLDTLSFGGVVNALHVEIGGSLTFKDLQLTGIAADVHNNSAEIESLPATLDSVVWPTIVADINTSLAYGNSQIRMEPAFGVGLQNCSETLSTFTLELSQTGTPYSRSGMAVQVPGNQTWHVPVANLTTDSDLGFATIWNLGNVTYICSDLPETNSVPPFPPAAPIPVPAEAPSVLPDEHNGTLTAQQQSGTSNSLNGGAIAGVIVAAVGAALVVGLAIALWWRWNLKRKQDPALPTQVPKGNDLSPGPDAVSSTTGSSSATSEGALQIDYARALWLMKTAQTTDPRDWGTKSSAGRLSGSAGVASVGGMINFDWRIEPHRIKVSRDPDGSLVRLGSGAAGTVFKATLDKVREVAVKVLHCSDSDPVSLEKFAVEVDLLRAMRDTNIVLFLGAWLQQGQAFMVQELMATDLYRALRSDTPGDRRFGWYNRGRQIALDVARGLHYLHTSNVVHLDIKSPNILLTSGWTAKIADVGIARALSKSHLSRPAPDGSGQAGGTYHWQAPETLLGLPSSFPADLFSYGVVLLEITTGCQPERGRYEKPEAPKDCPPEVANLIAQCMEQEPQARPSAKDCIRLIAGLGPQAMATDGNSAIAIDTPGIVDRSN